MARWLLQGGTSAAGFEVASPPMPPRLQPFVSSWTGYREWSTRPVFRTEYPTGRAVLILEFGPPIGILDATGETQRFRGGFFAAIDDIASVTELGNAQAGVQVNFTPRGARAFVAAPMHEVARRVLALADLDVDPVLADQLSEARGWGERFAVVTRFLDHRLDAAPSVSNVVAWALDRIDARFGARRLDDEAPRAGIAELCKELGYSRKHLHERFQQEVGLSPKRYADVRRFDHVVRLLRAGDRASLVDLAATAGYADQSHMARELRRFAGMTATTMRSSLEDPISIAVHELHAEGVRTGGGQ